MVEARRYSVMWVLAALLACSGPDGRKSPQEDTHSGGPTSPRLLVLAVDPAIVDPMGGSHLSVVGSGFGPSGGQSVASVEVGGAPAAFTVVSDSELQLVSAPVIGTDLDLVVRRGAERVVLEGAIDAWSPAELSGARLFDAASGLQLDEADTTYEWQRLTAEVHPNWRVRDGNSTVWLPSTERFWMVAGWNGEQEPVGFSPEPPGGWPPLNTTDEVWSSPDGVTWTPELAHGHGQFERRHSQNAVLWNDAIWMIGGDAHQGFYNHDVVRSPDGLTWEVVLGPGTTEPPWTERAMQVSGVYDGRLWTVGGQDLLGDPADYAYHNDVWVTDDGANWTEVLPDGPASDTRWGGCGVLDGLVEFQGELWLVGCAKEREDAVGHSMSNEVWSTADGVVWRRHTDAPWVGKIWPNVVVWDARMWILFGFTHGDPANGWPAGNANEVWWTADGEVWNALPHDSPQPGSHAQGVGVHPEFLLYAGGNYGFGYGAGFDTSTWRLVPFRGARLSGWTDRGGDGLTVAASGAERPLVDPNALGVGIPGVQFDGSANVLTLADPGGDEQAVARSVFWVGRAPYLPLPAAWDEVYAPVGTIVGGTGPTGYGSAQVGLSGGTVVAVNREPGEGPVGEPLWSRTEGGAGLQEGPGEVRFAGITHGADGILRVWVDGSEVDAGPADYGTPRGWRQIGGGLHGPYYGPNSRFAGALGAVVVLPTAADEATVHRIHAWAKGRFQAP